jgi:amidase
MFIKIDPVFKIYFISLALVILFLGCNTTPSKVLTNPNDFPFLEISIAELQTGYKQGKWTVEEVVSAYLDRIHQIDFSGPKLNAVIQLNPDALAIGRKLDSSIPEMRGM